MPRTLLKPRIVSDKKNKNKIRPELDNTKSLLPPNLQSFKQKVLSGNGFLNI